MTLDDETAARIAREVVDGGKAARVYLHPKDVALVRAGYAHRDAEVEELRAERDEALAIIERAKYRLIYDAPDDIYYDAHVSDALEILNTAPADALREHDAALIESLADEIVHEGVFARVTWLRKKARERREGV